MEGNLINIGFAFVGKVSLYLVIATLVGMGIYAATKKWNNKSDRIAAAIMGGALFPISVPITILVFWVWSIVSIPKRMSENQSTDVEECSQDVVDCRERVRALERSDEIASSESETVPKPKFKVGDLITGVRGNPANYKHLYEGCACRVIEVEGDKAMKVILVLFLKGIFYYRIKTK